MAAFQEKIFYYKYINAVAFSSQQLLVPDFVFFFGQSLSPAETELVFVLNNWWEADYTNVCIIVHTQPCIFFSIHIHI